MESRGFVEVVCWGCVCWWRVDVENRLYVFFLVAGEADLQ